MITKMGKKQRRKVSVEDTKEASADKIAQETKSSLQKNCTCTKRADKCIM